MKTDALKAQAEKILEGGKGKAAKVLEDGGKVDQLLTLVEEKLRTVPKAGEYLADVPRMIALLKDHVQKDYTGASKTSLILMVAALLYLVNPKDLIPDKYIGVGLIDDAAVVAACIALTRKDLDAYDAWKQEKKEQAAQVAEVEPVDAPDLDEGQLV